MAKTFNNAYPVVVALAGQAGAGKTSTADAICPPGHMFEGHIFWDHLWHVIPLYEFATARLKIEGVDETNRQLYQIHNIASELLSGSVGYYDLIDTVTELHTLPIDTSGRKPRTFLQIAGDICRSKDKDCFPKWIKKKVYQNWGDMQHLEPIQMEDAFHITLVSDTRYLNELEYLKTYPNTLTIKLHASTEVRMARLQARDGWTITEDQANHISELDVPKPEFDELIDLHLETDDLTPDEQVQAVKNIIYEFLPEYAKERVQLNG